MKEIRKAIHSLPEERRNALIARLQLKNRSEAFLVATIASYTGIHEIFTSLDRIELDLLKTVYQSRDGITFGEIEKALKVKISDISAVSESLSGLCLIYVLKNRQLINNKLDKAYGIAEIAEILCIEDITSFKAYLLDLPRHLKDSLQHKTQDIASMDDEDKRILMLLAQNGYIAPLDSIKGNVSRNAFETVLSRLIREQHVKLFHLFDQTFQTYIAIDPSIAHTVMQLSKHSSLGTTTASNRVFFLNNILATYDTVSTYGLFLTKQLEFRKIDIRRMSDSLNSIKNPLGQYLNKEKMAGFILYVLNKLGCLRLLKDTAYISLNEIQKELEHPIKLLQRILRALKNPKPENPFFPSPFEIPSMEILTTVSNTIYDMPGITPFQLSLISHCMIVGMSEKNDTSTLLSSYENHVELIKKAVELLFILGLVDIHKGLLYLSDIGVEALAPKGKNTKEVEPEEPKKTIYINPDFTMMIPLEEIGSKSLYSILSYVQIMKHDVIIHAQITKESIVKARKRGMQLKRFLEILADYAKNEIPQNMKFLVNEWSRQTIDISISNVIIIKTTHPTFIDELVVGRLKHCIIDRVSDTCAIIRKSCIDDIVKMGRKKDAVITLLSGEESED